MALAEDMRPNANLHIEFSQYALYYRSEVVNSTLVKPRLVAD
jgi:hypothetical protein